ncbi:DUF4259 domain-containing protein [Lentzea sp. CA-135723]|uniref:DUF4259 domain-containing protein n=1 Tax=Lentzea sp. CA-135723 TaxID=3239950 RepID=UPI003D901C6D
MGTWDIGHFDNDTAADFSGKLDKAAQAERESIVRTALTSTIETDDYLDSYEACQAVASAALIAAQLPGGTPITTAYAPDEPMPAFSPDLRALAASALDRVVAEDSELAELWDETEYSEKWRQSVAELKAVLLT